MGREVTGARIRHMCPPPYDGCGIPTEEKEGGQDEDKNEDKEERGMEEERETERETETETEGTAGEKREPAARG